MMPGLFSSFMRDTRGAAAAEMALLTPMLIGLMFGSFELGNYFLSQHAVVKAVRDGARYAGRQSFDEYTCSTVTTAAEDRIKNVTMTGQVATGGATRVRGWDNTATITVSVSCSATTTGGIYTGKAGGAPVVNVAASVPYSSIVGRIGLTDATLNLNANAQAAVTGL